MTNWRIVWLLLCGCALGNSFAQDAQFTQFYATPTNLSPAFAGTGLQTRFGMAYRDQWPSFPGSFVSTNLAIDHYMREVNSGIGLLISHDKAGSGALRYTSITGQYAYEIELKRKVFLRPALQFGYVNHAVDHSSLVFSDQLARGGAGSTYDHLNGQSISYADMGTGLLLFTPKFWIGFAIHHLNRPNQSLLMGEAIVPQKFSAHGGYRLTVKHPVIRKHEQNFVFAFNYKAQGKYDQLDVGVYFEREPFFTGLWYRGLPIKAYQPGMMNNDAIAVLLGVIVNDLRIGYSYDLTVSRLARHSGGAHELTLGYGLQQKNRKRSVSRRRIVPCAKF